MSWQHVVDSYLSAEQKLLPSVTRKRISPTSSTFGPSLPLLLLPAFQLFNQSLQIGLIEDHTLQRLNTLTSNSKLSFLMQNCPE